MKKHIALGVTGSIAAYKACELVRLLVKGGYEVSVVMTSSAERFVTALTFRTLSQKPVCTGLFENPEEWVPEHIGLADTCDALVIAPCTANVIAKLANGIADDSLSSLALACVKPLLIAPAMNVNMWNHPANQDNLAKLRERGAMILEPGEGDLACGVSAKGRMPEAAEIYGAIGEMLDPSKTRKPKK